MFEIDFKLNPRLFGTATGLNRASTEAELAKAAVAVGMLGERMMRKVIQGGVDPPNRPMTIALKRGNKPKPLVNTGRLWKSITSTVIMAGRMPAEIHIGVKRTEPKSNIAAKLHDGFSFTVTRRMAFMFMLLSLKSKGRRVVLTSARAKELGDLLRSSKPLYPLVEGSTIVVPPRPFAKIVANDPDFQSGVNKLLNAALIRVIAAGP